MNRATRASGINRATASRRCVAVRDAVAAARKSAARVEAVPGSVATNMPPWRATSLSSPRSMAIVSPTFTQEPLLRTDGELGLAASLEGESFGIGLTLEENFDRIRPSRCGRVDQRTLLQHREGGFQSLDFARDCLDRGVP